MFPFKQRQLGEIGQFRNLTQGHVGYWGNAFKKAIFEEKADQLDLCNSALGKGMRITLHSDNFISPLGPLHMMEQAVMSKTIMASSK